MVLLVVGIRVRKEDAGCVDKKSSMSLSHIPKPRPLNYIQSMITDLFVVVLTHWHL